MAAQIFIRWAKLGVWKSPLARPPRNPRRAYGRAGDEIPPMTLGTTRQVSGPWRAPS
jgi:hypothetical protein